MSSLTGSRALFPSSPTLTISSKPAAVIQNLPEGELEPGAGAGSYRAGWPVQISFGHHATPRSSHVVLTRHLGSASCSSSRLSFIKVLKPGQATTRMQPGCSDHLKDERLDLDGIWCSAQRLCSPAPSPFALPLGCLRCPVGTQTAVPSPRANGERWASPWCRQNGMGMEAWKLTGQTLGVSSS